MLLKQYEPYFEAFSDTEQDLKHSLSKFLGGGGGHACCAHRFDPSLDANTVYKVVIGYIHF